MAKKKKKKPFVRVLGSLVSSLKDDRFRYAMGIVFLLVALFMILSFISYLFNWKTDQDFEWSKVFSGPDIRVENQGGKLGAWLSNQFINRWFGVAGFLFPAILVIWAMSLYKIRVFNTWKTVRNCLLLIILLSITLGLLFGDASGILGSGPGGQHGYFLSKWLLASVGYFGTVFLLMICYIAMVLFSTNFLEWIRAQKTSFGNKPMSESEDPFIVNSVQPGDIHSEITDIPPPEAPSSPAPATSNDSPEKEDESPEKGDVEMTVEDFSGTNPDDFNPDEGALGEYDPTLDLPKYQYPPLSLLKDYEQGESIVSNEELISNKNRIVETLGNYSIKIEKIKATIGPTVTLYEIVPAPGIRISKIKSLEDDIALSLSALGIRIIAPIPGKGTIGIEVPNQKPRIVSMKSILSSKKFQDADMELAIAIGKTISNETFVFDLTKMPHLLVAGATGQGKSVGLNAIIASLLFKNHPARLKFVMVDPKKVELSLYSKIERHFLAKLPESEEAIITETKQVIHTLNSLCSEMDDRYNLLRVGQ